ncbi:alpha/beta fold hydrolase [Colwellia sp. KU-HH00111]|uniref:alpha/beta fold hydrolase n=1 Tax=Colwellia sp. KU-HH00111 TaxID=3127652 RepID=UPI0031037FC6
MSKANNAGFTCENKLPEYYSSDIADFWQQGAFASFSGVDQLSIEYAVFLHKTLARKCLVISPGRCEGYLKYKELCFDWFNQGFNIFIIDHRGQGLSERVLDNRDKGYVENFQYYIDDLATFIETIVYPHCDVGGTINKPYILAHSMGGAIVARYLQDYPKTIQAAVLSSPMFGFNSGAMPKVAAETVVKLAAKLNHCLSDSPWYFFGQKNYCEVAFTHNRLTHSPLRLGLFNELYSQTPALQLGGVTIQWLTESLRALETLFSKLDQIITPTLVIQAGSDKVVCNQAQTAFCQQLQQVQPLACASGSPLVITGAYHELFFERDIYRQPALTAAAKWFEQHTPA